MEYQPPQAVELTAEESQWNEQIRYWRGPDTDWTTIEDAMESLFNSLTDRNAIPEIRLRIFADPECAETRNKSPKQIFESKGMRGRDIYRNVHFINQLRYFIAGPELPAAVIMRFCQILNDDVGTSGMVLEQLCRFVRSSIREENLERHSAATNFFKLCHELEVGHYATSIREAAMSARRR